MIRAFGWDRVEMDLAELMRTAERAGLALGCIEPDETKGLVLPGDASDPAWTLGRVGAWAVTLTLAGLLMVL